MIDSYHRPSTLDEALHLVASEDAAVLGGGTKLIPTTTARSVVDLQGLGLDGIALGGTGEWGEWTMNPNEDARRRIVERAIDRYTAMRSPESTTRLTWSRTSVVLRQPCQIDRRARLT